MTKILRRIYIFNFIAVLILSVNMICSHNVYSELEYSKQLGKKISWQSLRYYSSIISIDRGTDDSVRICLHAKRSKSDKLLEDEYAGIDDIVNVKQTIDEYLDDNPNHILNDEKISVWFSGIADDCIKIRNFNENADGIWKFSGYYPSIDLSRADMLCDFAELKLSVSDSDELKKLEEWDNLQTVYLYGMEFSQEDKKYLLEILPNCDIYCNDENLS